jgi:hypothetical protein
LTGFLAAPFVQGLDGADALGPARQFIVIFRRLAQLPLASASTAEGASHGPLPAWRVPVPIKRRSRSKLQPTGDGIPRDRSTLVQMQQGKFGRMQFVRAMLGMSLAKDAIGKGLERSSMYYVAAALLVLSGLFYSASHHEIGSFGVTMCTYGSAFCDNPLIVFSGAALAGAWGMFVSIK